MAQELVSEPGPGSSLDACPGGATHGCARRGVGGELRHRAPQQVGPPGGEQPAVHAVAHQVHRTAGGGGDDGNAGRECLLHGLAERLGLARMHEHVERRDRRRQVTAGAEPEEAGAGQASLETRAQRAVAHDHEARVGQVGKAHQALHLLLGREATDIADDDFAPGRNVTPHELAPVRGVEAVDVDAAPPPGDGREPALLQLPCDHR